MIGVLEHEGILDLVKRQRLACAHKDHPLLFQGELRSLQQSAASAL